MEALPDAMLVRRPAFVKKINENTAYKKAQDVERTGFKRGAVLPHDVGDAEAWPPAGAGQVVSGDQFIFSRSREARGLGDELRRDNRVTRRDLDRGVFEQHLDHAQVRGALEQVRRETVLEHVSPGRLSRQRA